MNPADGLTSLRVVLTPVVMVLWASSRLSAHWIGLMLFVVAGLTDFFDGKLARRSTPTVFGAYLDPLADKILVMGAASMLVATHHLSVWLLFVILVRELSITGLRSVLPHDKKLPASYLAKWKTTGQLFAVGSSSVMHGWIPDILWAIAIFLTVWTAGEYFWQHWPRKTDSPK